MFDLKLLVCTLIVFVTTCHSARILGIVPSFSYSHQVAFHPIWRALSLRGHQVTTYTTDPIGDSSLVNLTEISLHSAYSIDKKLYVELIKMNPLDAMFAILDVFEVMLHNFLSNVQVQELINSDEKFDVVLIEFYFLPVLAFAKKFNAPMIAISSIDATDELLTAMGNPTHPIVFPNWYASIEDSQSFVDRLKLVGIATAMRLFTKFYINPIEQKLVEKYFGPGYPSAEELKQEISLALVNSDPIFSKVKPLLPTVIQIGGGYHERSSESLPTELQKTLDDSKTGFIYFSLGSNANSKDLCPTRLKVMLDAFSELPYIVLWKFESDLPNKPKNVITSKWLPQPAVLKHPKILLFITQGGLQSTSEAVYAHVPMIGMPFFGDQNYNINKLMKRGVALSIDYKTMTKKEFKDTINEVVTNPKYRNRLKELANMAVDQPMTSLEKAVWWTEYVIRHNGTQHLRSPLLDIPFYQYYMLDIAAVLMLILIVLISVLRRISTLLYKLIVRSSTPKRKIKKK